jgi:hypothetical protein
MKKYLKTNAFSAIMDAYNAKIVILALNVKKGTFFNKINAFNVILNALNVLV